VFVFDVARDRVLVTEGRDPGRRNRDRARSSPRRYGGQIRFVHRCTHGLRERVAAPCRQRGHLLPI
jgi:hypothetical protein